MPKSKIANKTPNLPNINNNSPLLLLGSNRTSFSRRLTPTKTASSFHFPSRSGLTHNLNRHSLRLEPTFKRQVQTAIGQSSNFHSHNSPEKHRTMLMNKFPQAISTPVSNNSSIRIFKTFLNSGLTSNTRHLFSSQKLYSASAEKWRCNHRVTTCGTLPIRRTK